MTYDSLKLDKEKQKSASNKLGHIVLAAILVPVSFIWAHGDSSAILILFMLLGAIPALPLTFASMRYLLRRYPVSTKGNIPVALAQIVAVSAAIGIISNLINETDMIKSAFRPILTMLWLGGNLAVFARFCWLESQNVPGTVMAALLGCLEVVVLAAVFGLCLGLLFRFLN